MSTFLDAKTIAELTARMYLDTGAVRFMTDKPFIFTSGWASPIYNDSRWLISFPDVRATLMEFMISGIDREIGRGNIDCVAAARRRAFRSRRLSPTGCILPMQYVRKKAKGFGRGSQIEGRLLPGQRVLLVEDLATDGRSCATATANAITATCCFSTTSTKTAGKSWTTSASLCMR
jgi:orotate phosphoribosyltransferase